MKEINQLTESDLFDLAEYVTDYPSKKYILSTQQWIKTNIKNEHKPTSEELSEITNIETKDFIIDRVRYRCIYTDDVKVNDFIIYSFLNFNKPNTYRLFKINYMSKNTIRLKEYQKKTIMLENVFAKTILPAKIIAKKLGNSEGIYFKEGLKFEYKKTFYKVIKIIKDYT